MRKNILFILVAVTVMSMTFSGCGANAAAETPVKATTTVAEKEDVQENELEVETEVLHDISNAQDDNVVTESFRSWLEWFADVDADNPEGFSSFTEGEAYDALFSAAEISREQLETIQSEIKNSTYTVLYIWDNNENDVYIGAAWQDGMYVISKFKKTPDGLVMSGELPPEKYLCPRCNGEGSVIDSVGTGTVCGICSGTGVQWQHNQYYDAVLGWQTQDYTVACGGCGGIGYIGGTPTTYKLCPDCLGMRYSK